MLMFPLLTPSAGRLIAGPVANDVSVFTQFGLIHSA